MSDENEEQNEKKEENNDVQTLIDNTVNKVLGKAKAKHETELEELKTSHAAQLSEVKTQMESISKEKEDAEKSKMSSADRFEAQEKQITELTETVKLMGEEKLNDKAEKLQLTEDSELTKLLSGEVPSNYLSLVLREIQDIRAKDDQGYYYKNDDGARITREDAVKGILTKYPGLHKDKHPGQSITLPNGNPKRSGGTNNDVLTRAKNGESAQDILAEVAKKARKDAGDKFNRQRESTSNHMRSQAPSL